MGCGFESHRGHDASWVAPASCQELAGMPKACRVLPASAGLIPHCALELPVKPSPAFRPVPLRSLNESCGRVCPFHMSWKGLRDRPSGRFQFRNVAQLGSALGWGPRGRGFKSHHSDALIPRVWPGPSVRISLPYSSTGRTAVFGTACWRFEPSWGSSWPCSSVG